MLLYKYIDNHILDVLENSSLKFSPRDQLNDPFELYPFFEPNEGFEPNEEDINNSIEEIGEDAFQENYLRSIHGKIFITKTRAEWLEFEKDTRNVKNPYKEQDPKNWAKNYYEDLIPSLLNALDKTFVILSLTENALSIPMWAHYGSNNKGFVIGFETDNDFFFEKDRQELSYRNLRKVNYSYERMIIKDIYNMDEVEATFFCKSIEWKYENEWRVLRRLEDAVFIESTGLYLFRFNRKIIKEIYFGFKCDSETKNRVIGLVKSNSEYQDVKFFQITLDEKDYKLIPHPISV